MVVVHTDTAVLLYQVAGRGTKSFRGVLLCTISEMDVFELCRAKGYIDRFLVVLLHVNNEYDDQEILLSNLNGVQARETRS